ncbi:MAG: hypothetical protein ACK4L7_12420, partial [Flavobacteriales bacterium]
MKNLLPIAALALLAACQTDPKETPQYRQLAEDAARARAQAAERDSAINALFGAMNRIGENLRTIRAKQGQLVQSGGGEKADLEQQMAQDLASIDALLDENRTLIAQMRKQAKASAATIAELEKTIAGLEASVLEKDAEIGTLKEQLA